MIDIDQALSLISDHARPLPPAPAPIGAAVGLVLAEDVISDIDSPPYDKALMDGYAVIAADLQRGAAELRVLEEVTAGNTPTTALAPGTTARVMTGAPLPDGADLVIVVEQAEQIDGNADALVRFRDAPPEPGRNIMRRGTSLERGDTVLRSGRVLTAIDVGLASEVGRPNVLVHPRPRVAVLATGNELVSSSEVPKFGQIRNSNGPMLCALVEDAGGVSVDLGIGRDERTELTDLVERGLEEDVLVLSGGVSAGVLDLVPEVLDRVGVRQVFHKVRVKPGKPLWFGVGVFTGISVYGNLAYGLFASSGNFPSWVVATKPFILAGSLPILVLFLSELLSDDRQHAAKEAEKEAKKVAKQTRVTDGKTNNTANLATVNSDRTATKEERKRQLATLHEQRPAATVTELATLLDVSRGTVRN